MNKKIDKKILSSLVLITVAVGSFYQVSAEPKKEIVNTKTTTITSTAVYNSTGKENVNSLLTLDEAINETISNNEFLKSLEFVIDTKQVDKNEKTDNANKISENFVKNLDLAKVKYFLPYDAQIQVEIAKIDKEEQENNIVLNTINSYLDVLSLQSTVEVLENAVARSEEQVNIAKLNYDLGLITKVDVLSSEYQLVKTQNDLEQAKNNLKIKKMQLNQLLNRNTELEITALEPELGQDIPLGQEGVLIGLDYNLDLKKKNLELQSLEKLLEVTARIYPKNTYDYKAVDSMIKTKQSIINETTARTEVSIKSQQIQMESLLNKHEVMVKQVEKAEETYNIMLEQYKAGLISYQDLADIDQLLKQTELEELKSKLDYYKTVYQYKYTIGIK